MKYRNWNVKGVLLAAALCVTSLSLAGCPTADPQGEYDTGYAAGFLRDDYYWQGFQDSYDTVDAGTIYYAGSDIPIYDTPPYDAGYWDGVWYAYNDGYFVEYDYAFTIGFSEGYDVAFQPGYAAFLQGDTHLEYQDGGFSDGYNDGFSEGRVFGAYDYKNGLPFDWLNAELDYRAGTDLTVAGVSTGASGPVELYVYGTDPATGATGKQLSKRTTSGAIPAIRVLGIEKAAASDLSYRDLTDTVRSEFSTHPTVSPRSTASLRVEGSWLDRILAYRAALAANTAAKARR